MAMTMKNKVNSLVQWQTFLKNVQINAQNVKEDIKGKTEPERAKLKYYNDQIKIARWKCMTINDEIKELTENSDSNSISVSITLDDFDVGDSIDYELAVGEYKKYLKEQKEEKN